MEQLNLHKLINLKKRFAKYECSEASTEILAVIDKHILLEKNKSKTKDTARRMDYQNESVCCKFCGAIVIKHKGLYLYMQRKGCSDIKK